MMDKGWLLFLVKVSLKTSIRTKNLSSGSVTPWPEGTGEKCPAGSLKLHENDQIINVDRSNLTSNC